LWHGVPAAAEMTIKIWGQSPKINNGYRYLRANPPQ